MKKQKKILIVFPDRHLAYSQTTLNLLSLLAQKHVVKIAAFKSETYEAVKNENIFYIKENPFVFRFLNFVLANIFFIKSYTRRLILWQKLLVMMHILFNRYDEFIAVDMRGYWFVKSFTYKKIHLLSLELSPSPDDFINKINFKRISTIIIQNEERLNYLTSGKFKGRAFFIQNAPTILKDFKKTNASKNKLIYVGTARLQFGINYCLDFIKKYPEYELYVHGHVEPEVKAFINSNYSELLSSGRLAFNQTYLTSEELIEIVSKYRIGFCFYDFKFPEINNFNYLSAPSGKMFTCYAAGVPIIASNIIGLNSISQFEAGKQISKYTPDEIKNAIDLIESNYNSFSQNCLKAAEHFDFKKNAALFVDYLEK